VKIPLASATTALLARVWPGPKRSVLNAGTAVPSSKSVSSPEALLLITAMFEGERPRCRVIS
jgi:hypothetical protein